MSFQLTVMKVLAGHSEGRASIADLTRCVAILSSSGADWSDRMKRLAARAPSLDIFRSGYVLRQDTGWLLTNLGLDFLKSIEALAEPALETVAEVAALDVHGLPANVIQMVDYKGARRRRAAA